MWNIFEQSLSSTMLRTKDSGTILKRKLLPERSKAIFKQEAPALTSRRIQEVANKQYFKVLV